MVKTNHYVIRGVIELRSGTRIGGSDDVLQIGGTDLSCIKDPVNGRPYLPGSSLKGRMRSALEKAGKARGPIRNQPCGCGGKQCPVCVVFGPHLSKSPDPDLGPSRIIVRDAHCLEDFTIERKTSTAVDRSTGTGLRGSLRTEERVCPGSKFRLEIGLQEFDTDAQFPYEDADGTAVNGRDALIAVVYHCIDLLEDAGIGAGVGKGSGEIRITLDDVVYTKRRRRKVPTVGSETPPDVKP